MSFSTLEALVDRAAQAREARANKSPTDQAAINEKIGQGVKRAARKRRAEQRAIHLIREAVPDLDAGIRAIVIVLESDDSDE